MVQSMISVVVPIDPDRVDATQSAIGTRLGNPAGEVRTLIDGAPGSEFVHFASLQAVRSHKAGQAYLVMEISADGEPRALLEELARRAGDALLPIFQVAKPGLAQPGLGAFLEQHRITNGFGLFQAPGIAFSGEPGLSVPQVKQEAALGAEVARLIGEQGEAASSLARLEMVKSALASNPAWAWTLEPPPPAPAHPAEPPTIAGQIGALGPAFVAVFLWPVLVVAVPLAAWLAWPGAWPSAWQFLVPTLVFFLLYTLGLVALGTIIAVVTGYLLLRRGEASDWTADAAPELSQNSQMFAHENAPGYAHNHMMSHTVRKPGIIRAITLRLALFAVVKLTALNPKPGFLGDIGTIHFARWLTIPGTRDLIFFSNYGGSWESYLEDFITRAHAGLTAVWSNTIGFPRTNNLFMDGATDGERFKRFARASMRATPFWYSAYPRLTTANIRTNSLIRRGLHVATEAEANEWLSLFGSSPRPPAKLDTTQIQSIVFGGLGFKPEGRLLTVRLGTDVAANQAWLAGLMPVLAFNDGRYIKADAVVTLSLTPTGLARLGLPDDALETFPAAFRLGMRGEGRDRILGDDASCADWWWQTDTVEACLLVYGDTIDAVAACIDRVTASLAPVGTVSDSIELGRVGEHLVDRKEPFGFVDGVSQPAIRGTYRGLRNADPIHLVEPGEIIMGYPDNRGGIPPGPMLDARHDPAMILPIAGETQGFTATIKSNPREIGLNGSFLVVRQLEQEHDLFWDYCAGEAARLEGRFPEPVICDAEFIAAKLIGRWTDGSSLARNPYMSATRLRDLYSGGQGAPPSREKSNPVAVAATPVETADRGATVDDDDDTGGGKPIQPDNDFLFGTEDPQGLRCPYGAHVRRANPRDSLSPGSNEQIGITNRHRILRIGRGFRARDDRKSGLMFMCLNGDIERQFEFIQQTWMGSVKFHGLDCETDAIAVAGKTGSNGYTIPVRTGPVSLSPLPRFVTLRGGGYFFVPGRQLLRYLAQGAGTPAVTTHPAAAAANA